MIVVLKKHFQYYIRLFPNILSLIIKLNNRTKVQYEGITNLKGLLLYNIALKTSKYQLITQFC